MSINTRLLICRLLIVWITIGTAYGMILIGKLDYNPLIVGLIMLAALSQFYLTDIAVRGFRWRKSDGP